MGEAGLSEAGLTLVEMLIVLAIIGVMGGVAVLAAGGAGRVPGVEAEARRLATSIQLAADESLVTDQPLALAWDAKGYAFLTPNPDARGGSVAELSERHDLPAELLLTGTGVPSATPISQDNALAMTLSGEEQSWNVRFDGLNATARPGDRG